MQKLMGLMRRCVEDYGMIAPGDKIAVGVSGGKDSLVLLVLLAGLRKYVSIPFELEAITIDMGLGMDYSGVEELCRQWQVPYTIVPTQLAGLRKYVSIPFELEAITIDMGLGMDYSGVEELCRQWQVPYTIVPTQIAPIIFDYRKEKNPCSMCAKMRRGALNQAILDKGFHKLALGHHFDDAVETFLMSLLFEGRISCFQPVTDLDRTGIIQIRPMLYIHERTVDNFAQKMELPVIENGPWTTLPRKWSCR